METRKHMEMVNLSFLMEDVLSDFNRRHPSLRASSDIDDRVLVKGNYDMLRAAIQNLINGAIRFTDKSVSPCIVYGQVGYQQIHLMIDNGHGFKMSGGLNDLVLSSLSGSTQAKPTIKRLIVKHGGNVWGTVGETIGAVFRFPPN